MGVISIAGLLCLFLLPTPYEMVKQQDFKTCNQSGFCVRQSAFAKIQQTQPQFLTSIPQNSIKVSSSTGVFTSDILFNETIVFKLKISALSDNTVRLVIKEKDSVKFEQTDEFVGYKATAGVPFLTNTRDKVLKATTITFEGDEKVISTLFIQEYPLNIILLVDGKSVFNFNDKQYFHYEHSRTKPVLDKSNEEEGSKNEEVPEKVELSEEELELTRLNDELNKDLWEESFGNHVDSKPYGPASIGFDITFPGMKYIYGLPEHASDFNLKNTKGPDDNSKYNEPYRLYNFDVFEYIMDSPMALYGSVPFIMGHKKYNSVGVLMMNAAEMWVDVERSISSNNETSTHVHWMTESGILDLFIFLGPSPKSISTQLSIVTGSPAMPQLFAISYHQCRWNYNDEVDVKEVDAAFDRYQIPYDVLWLDIEHTDGKKYFTWDSVKFPNPVEMMQGLAKVGRKMVTIVDPHIKKDAGYSVSKEAGDQDLFVKDKNGEVFKGWCWPGDSNWLDYLNPTARTFWSSLFDYKKYIGSTETLYTWNDMNEPSVFTGPEVTMPKDNLHHGKVEHRDMHNIYGMLQHQSTFEGHLSRSTGEDRPFVLSRAFFAGTQKYGAIWTGDNAAEWSHLKASVPMLLSVGISGIPFAGADVGGFFGNPDATLLLRWYQVAAFQPFFRAHAHIDTKRREPWLFGEPYTSLIKAAIQNRYKILPYLYTLNFQANQLGWPVMRPMMMEFPNDVNTFAMDDQFMLGDALMIKPVTSNDQTSVDVYLPHRNLWYDYDTFEPISSPDDKHDGIVNILTPLEKIPIFIRGGCMVTRRDRIRRSSSLTHGDPYTLIIALDRKSAAKGSLYVDDGKSYNHEKGEFINIEMEYKTSTKSSLLQSTRKPIPKWGGESKSTEEFASKYAGRIERLIVTGVKPSLKRVYAWDDGEEKRELEFTKEGNVVVVKDPKVLIGKDWKVKFDFVEDPAAAYF